MDRETVTRLITEVADVTHPRTVDEVADYVMRHAYAIDRPAPVVDPEAVYQAIKHGDEVHRDWLKEACYALASGIPVPAPRAATPIDRPAPVVDRDAVEAICTDLKIGTQKHMQGRPGYHHDVRSASDAICALAITRDEVIEGLAKDAEDYIPGLNKDRKYMEAEMWKAHAQWLRSHKGSAS